MYWTGNKPGELCYELQEQILYIALNHYPDNMPSDTLATMLYANHLQWKPNFHPHSRLHHMGHAKEPRNQQLTLRIYRDIVTEITNIKQPQKTGINVNKHNHIILSMLLTVRCFNFLFFTMSTMASNYLHHGICNKESLFRHRKDSLHHCNI